MQADKSILGIKFNEIVDFSVSEIDQILSFFEFEDLRKKTILVSPNVKAEKLFFIVKGCLRLYYEKDGEEISTYFFTEEMFAVAFESFMTGEKSRCYLDVIEDSVVISITSGNWRKLHELIPKMNIFSLKVLQERFYVVHNLFASFILDSPEERYLNLLRNQPHLLQRIPQSKLASFLGITPVSLSRIRSRILF